MKTLSSSARPGAQLRQAAACAGPPAARAGPRELREESPPASRARPRARLAHRAAVGLIEARPLARLAAAQRARIEARHQPRVRQRGQLEGEQRRGARLLRVQPPEVLLQQGEQLRVGLVVARQLAAQLHGVQRAGNERQVLPGRVVAGLDVDASPAARCCRASRRAATRRRVNGSSAPAKRRLLLRAPAANAVSFPCSRVRSVTSRSASP